MSEILLSIISALVSILAGGLASLVLERIRTSSKKVEREPSVSYSERLAALTRNLASASSEVDRVLKEMSEVSRQREAAISELELKLKGLVERERHLQEKIETLEKVPIPAVEYFVSEVTKGEKRSALRDYILFGLGVVVSTLIAIGLKLVFGI